MSPTAQAARFLGREGEVMTISEWVAGTTPNAYGDFVQTPTDRNVMGLFEPLGTPTLMLSSTGRQVQVDGKAYLTDGDEPAESADAAKLPSLTTKAGHLYIVARVSPAQNGVRTLFCESKR